MQPVSKRNTLANGLIHLEYNPISKASNFQEFKKCLIDYCFVNLNFMSAAINAGVAKQFIEPVPPADNAARPLQERYALELKEFYKEKELWKTNNRILFGLLKQCMSNSLNEKVESNALYANALNDESGINLWLIIVAIIVGKAPHETDARKSKRIQDAFIGCVQERNESIPDFITRFRNSIKDFQIAGVNPPSDEIQALTFIDNLNQFNSDFRTSIATATCNGRAEPLTLQEAISRLEEFNCLKESSIGYSQRHSNLHSTSSSIGYTRGGYFCSFCNKPGHDNNHCRKKKHQLQQISNSHSQSPTTISTDLKESNDDHQIQRQGRRGRGNNRGRGRGRRNSRSRERSNSNSNSNTESKTNHVATLEDYGSDYRIRVLGTTSQNSNEIIYDSGAQVSVFSNKNLLHNIRFSEKAMNIEGINKNGKPIKCEQIGDFLNFGSVYISNESSTNILSAYQVHQNSNSINFNYIENQYEVIDFDDNLFIFKCQNELYVMRTTPTANIFTGIVSKRDCETFNLVNEMREKLGFCSYETLAQLIRNGTFIFPFGTEEVYKTMRNAGLSIGEIKGKTKKVSFKYIRDISINNNNHRKQLQTLEVDIMIIEKQHFLISLSLPMNLISVEHLPHSPKSSNVLREAINKHVTKLNNHNFHVKNIKCDNEPGIIALSQYYLNQGIEVLPGSRSSKNTSTPTLDAKIRSLKEKVRTIIHSLYYILPLTLLKYCVTFAAIRLNMISNSTSTLSPREILTGKKLNFKKDLRLSFGQIVQIIIPDSDNSLSERTSTCIALHPVLDQTGSNYFWPLRSNNQSIIKRDSWKSTSINDCIIHFINQLSYGKPHIKIDEVYRSLGSGNSGDESIIKELYDDINNYQNSVQQSSGIRPNIQLFNSNNNNNLNLSNPQSQIIENNNTTNNTNNIIESIQPSQTININNNESNNQQTSTNNNNNINNQNIIIQPINSNNNNNINNNIIQPNSSNTLIENTNNNIQSSTSSSSSTTTTTSNNIVNPNVNDLDSINSQTTNSTSNNNSDSISTPVQDNSSTLRRSTRSNIGNKYEQIMEPLKKKGFTLTVKEAVNTNNPDAIQSIINEFNQMKKLKVYEPVHIGAQLEHKCDIIPAKMITKQKLDPNGNVIKWKSRLVAGGHRQTENSYLDTSSPTMDISTLYILCNVALQKNMNIITADVVGAYLNAPMDQHIYMNVNKRLSEYLIKSDNEYKDYIKPDGTIMVKLKKALYGCKQSGKLWYDKISSILTSLKFIKSKYDECLFVYNHNNNYIIIGLYVDDLWIMSKNKESQDFIIKQLTNKLYGITVNYGNDQNYLGMNFLINPNSIKITMNGYINNILESNNITTSVKTPTNADAFKINEKLEILNEHEQEEIRSTVYKLLYLSNRIRPDIAPITNFLCTRINTYTIQDKFKLNRILKYLHGTRDFGLNFTKSNNSNINIFADASHGIHADGKGHSGLIIMYNNNMILFKSKKQKITSLSSTESELICLSDSTSYIINTLNIFNELDITINNKIIYQDNLSTIQMINNEKPTSQRSKHINLKYFSIRERIKDHNININYLETKLMIADILTKPLFGNLFNNLRKSLFNINE